MATSAVATLEAQLDGLLKEIERMQEEYPDKEFPDHVAETWDRNNKQIDEYKAKLQIARREERMEELKRSVSHDGAQERPGAPGFQIGNARWRELPFVERGEIS